MKYGKMLKFWRKKEEINQQELAKCTGISQQALSEYENNKKQPTIEKCVILADFYGISVDELIGHDIKKNWKN